VLPLPALSFISIQFYLFLCFFTMDIVSIQEQEKKSTFFFKALYRTKISSRGFMWDTKGDRHVLLETSSKPVVTVAGKMM
ncbi:MAG: hypothetical protein ACRC4N_15265, partial [Gammaproteobacteria bacterium]